MTQDPDEAARDARHARRRSEGKRRIDVQARADTMALSERLRRMRDEPDYLALAIQESLKGGQK